MLTATKCHVLATDATAANINNESKFPKFLFTLPPVAILRAWFLIVYKRWQIAGNSQGRFSPNGQIISNISVCDVADNLNMAVICDNVTNYDNYN